MTTLKHDVDRTRKRSRRKVIVYRTLGRTGYKASPLGFGAMRLPMKEVNGDRAVDRELAIPMIHRVFEAGLNYIDTAVGYCNQDSQRAVGEALKGRREKIFVSTKNHYYDELAREARPQTPFQAVRAEPLRSRRCSI